MYNTIKPSKVKSYINAYMTVVFGAVQIAEKSSIGGIHTYSTFKIYIGLNLNPELNENALHLI